MCNVIWSSVESKLKRQTLKQLATVHSETTSAETLCPCILHDKHSSKAHLLEFSTASYTTWFALAIKRIWRNAVVRSLNVNCGRLHTSHHTIPRASNYVHHAAHIAPYIASMHVSSNQAFVQVHPTIRLIFCVNSTHFLEKCTYSWLYTGCRKICDVWERQHPGFLGQRQHQLT